VVGCHDTAGVGRYSKTESAATTGRQRKSSIHLPLYYQWLTFVMSAAEWTASLSFAPRTSVRLATRARRKLIVLIVILRLMSDTCVSLTKGLWVGQGNAGIPVSFSCATDPTCRGWGAFLGGWGAFLGGWGSFLGGWGAFLGGWGSFLGGWGAFLGGWGSFLGGRGHPPCILSQVSGPKIQVGAGVLALGVHQLMLKDAKHSRRYLPSSAPQRPPTPDPA